MLGLRLRISRETQGLSRKDLSRISNIDQTTIYKIETEKIKNPSLSTIESLARALNNDVFYLLGATDDPVRKSEQLQQDQIKIDSPLKVEQVRKLIDEFQEITNKLEKPHRSRAQKVRPYYPLYVNIPLDSVPVILDELPDSARGGHVSIEYHEQVDYLVKIKGTVMAPLYSDGDLLYLRRYEHSMIRDEDVALFFIKEKGITVVRQAFFHRSDNKSFIGLKSLNPQNTSWYENSPEVLVCQAKVVGSEKDKAIIRKLLMGRKAE
ncbi:MAG: helix-turn-helix domain-containing protein [Vulcanimicrobiota bacterium]